MSLVEGAERMGMSYRQAQCICDNALFEGYVRHLKLPLGPDVIDSVARDLGL